MRIGTYIFQKLIIALALLCAVSCAKDSTESQWAGQASWYVPSAPFDESKTDVFYLLSTEVVSARDNDGQVLYTARLTDDDLKYLTDEAAFVESQMFHTDFNFISPYYHQLTFEAFMLEKEQMLQEYNHVKDEVFAAFDYYMEHQNGGRHFVIAGFSQGAMLAVDLLKHMTDEQYSRLAAAYILGYRLSKQDLIHPHVKAAESNSDTQVAVSFNTVINPDAAWPLATEGAATCINPVNWKTDATPASFTFESGTGTITLDTLNYVLIADMSNNQTFRDWNRSNPVFSSLGVNPDCLHHWDLLFYTDQIHDNALLRSRRVLIPN